MTPVRNVHRFPRFSSTLSEALMRDGAHVYLSENRNKPDGRVLQKTLQAMGCKVTHRVKIATT